MSHLLGRVPLRIKLVAAILVLVTAAMLVISTASTFAMRSYLVSNQMDGQLRNLAQFANMPQYADAKVILPPGYFQAATTPNGVGADMKFGRQYTLADLPQLVTGRDAVNKVDGRPFTAVSVNGRYRWRVLVTVLPNQEVLHLGANLSTVDSAVSRLIFAELLAGGGVLILLVILGAAMVRASLGPLRDIERTAAAIAGGDLTRRVPDYEPGDEEPRTEVGRLSRALNTMLGYIETAFIARAQSEHAARSSEARARLSEERMRRFVADASHELRTPLTSIRGFAELYRQVAVREPEQAEKLVRRIEDEAARMGLLVEDLLLLARLDQERPLVPVELELRVIANDAVIAAQAVAPDRRIELEIPEGTGPVEVLADESRLRQVVGNLMTNALTHTPAGTPVWLRLRREESQAIIEVIDNGPGLTPEQAEHVFERFYRADAARTRRAGGTGSGLGLAIVAALVAAHDGTVEVDSEAGQGAIFRVRLPIHS